MARHLAPGHVDDGNSIRRGERYISLGVAGKGDADGLVEPRRTGFGIDFLNRCQHLMAGNAVGACVDDADRIGNMVGHPHFLSIRSHRHPHRIDAHPNAGHHGMRGSVDDIHGVRRCVRDIEQRPVRQKRERIRVRTLVVVVPGAGHLGIEVGPNHRRKAKHKERPQRSQPPLQTPTQHHVALPRNRRATPGPADHGRPRTSLRPMQTEPGHYALVRPLSTIAGRRAGEAERPPCEVGRRRVRPGPPPVSLPSQRGGDW